MKAQELRVTDPVYKVLSDVKIEEYYIRGISIKKDEKDKWVVGIKIESGQNYIGYANAHRLTNDISKEYYIFTSLEAAETHQKRIRRDNLAAAKADFKNYKRKYIALKRKYSE